MMMSFKASISDVMKQWWTNKINAAIGNNVLSSICNQSVEILQNNARFHSSIKSVAVNPQNSTFPLIRFQNNYNTNKLMSSPIRLSPFISSMNSKNNDNHQSVPLRMLTTTKPVSLIEPPSIRPSPLWTEQKKTLPPSTLLLSSFFFETNTIKPCSSVLFSSSNHTSSTCRYKHTVKTNSSMKKRFRVRGDGKTLVRSHSGMQHNTGYKNRRRCNALGQSTTIKNEKMHKKIKRCLGL